MGPPWDGNCEIAARIAIVDIGAPGRRRGSEVVTQTIGMVGTITVAVVGHAEDGLMLSVEH